MIHKPTISWAEVWMLASSLVIAMFVFQHHIGLDLSDEGYLWHGVWRVLEGEIPRVDFRCYDAPRNYWLAFWCLIFGEGPLGMRAGVALFQIIGLSMGLMALRNAVPCRVLFVGFAAILLIWMFPRHKYFEHAISMSAVYVGFKLLQSTSQYRVFWSGFFVGMAGSFRRNHALYTGVSMSALIMYNHRSKLDLISLSRDFAVFGAGIVLGLFPVWIPALVFPEYANAYLDSIYYIFRFGKTNMPLDVKWPWLIKIGEEGLPLAIHELAVGCAFLLPFVFYPFALIKVMKKSVRDTTHGKLLLDGMSRPLVVPLSVFQ